MYKMACRVVERERWEGSTDKVRTVDESRGLWTGGDGERKGEAGGGGGGEVGKGW